MGPMGADRGMGRPMGNAGGIMLGSAELSNLILGPVQQTGRTAAH